MHLESMLHSHPRLLIALQESFCIGPVVASAVGSTHDVVDIDVRVVSTNTTAHLSSDEGQLAEQGLTGICSIIS